MKKVVWYGLALLIVIVLTAGWNGDALSQARGPIRIGFIAPTTGTFAANGRDMLNGFLLFWEEKGFTVAGRKVEIIHEDDAGVPANTLTKARKLVEQDKVHMLVGPLTASSGYALRDYVHDGKVATIYPIVSADDITQRRRTPYIVRVGWTSSQPAHPFGEWVAKNLGYKRIATIAYDFAFGHEWVGGFQRTFEENGGRIVQKLWPPIGAPDYAPYLAQLRKDVDAVFAVFSGGDALRFLAQYQEFGLKGRIPLIGGGTLTDEHVLPQMGNEAVGIITALHYSAVLETPENRTFASAYARKYSRPPSYYSENCYTAGRFIYEALVSIRGNVEDKERFLGALRKIRIPDAPRGPVYLDEYQNPVQNIYIRRVDRRGILRNTVIFTYPKVSQFWKYNPEEYLKQPVYSRDYPPIRP
ncbi:MAG: ABC transporter substrate-binding protein [Armatimonadota bacterium]|nr:ABC transporter substrate-binding protein [Armatimonadota bacterium]MDR5702719.1 ABC transporter substrate-binding protein [Armatimonadota bacterium]MDR7434859.1 ABC transporter substrate-binding protein [Armatimonadota bacterium]